MRSVPHSGFSRDSRAMSSRTSELSRGRPAGRPDFHHQKGRHPWRCQRMTVSGWTSTSWRRQSRHRRRTTSQNTLSRRRSRGWGWVRSTTASCWRSRRFSSTRSRRPQSSERAAPNTSNSHSIEGKHGRCGARLLPDRLLTPYRPFMKTPAQGAATSIHLASAPALERVTGRYFANRTWPTWRTPRSTSRPTSRRGSPDRCWK